jgi:hypothetical protein
MSGLEDFPAPVKLKLSAAWAATMFLYIYGDYFYMYVPGKLAAMAASDLGIGRATDTLLLAVSIMMAVPSLMIFLSLILAPALNKWLNVVLGLAYSLIVLMTMRHAPLFYLFFGSADVLMTLIITWIALTWRKQAA